MELSPVEKDQRRIMLIEKAERVMQTVIAAYNKARIKHEPMRNGMPHEGYAVILEEMDELWDEVKRWQPKSSMPELNRETAWEEQQSKLRKEALHVAAMALAFLVEVTGE